MPTSSSIISGKCFCGQSQYRCNSSMTYTALCHCEDCRRAASSDYVSWFGLPKSEIQWSGPRKFFKSSENVTRSFCENCGSPLTFETTLIPGLTHLYASTLDHQDIYLPTAHLHWSEKAPWVSLSDNLPKHPKGLQDATRKGQKLL